MEDELWKALYPMIRAVAKRQRPRKARYTDGDVVATYLWAVLHDRPVSWATQARNWPIYWRRRALPSCATMSRRLRTVGVQEVLRRLEQGLIEQHRPGVCRWIDAKPLAISGATQDPDAGYGRAASCKAKGYKLYAVADGSQGFVAWAVGPMNVGEATVARELIAGLRWEGYLVGDNAYDSNALYDLAGARSIQLIGARRPTARSLGHHRHSQHRLRSVQLTAKPFGQDLLASRNQIERMFAQLTNFAAGLGPLPNWVRRRSRVEWWIRGKMILYHLWRNRTTLLAA